MRGLGTTRSAKVKPGDMICEAGIYREGRRLGLWGRRALWSEG